MNTINSKLLEFITYLQEQSIIEKSPEHSEDNLVLVENKTDIPRNKV